MTTTKSRRLAGTALAIALGLGGAVVAAPPPAMAAKTSDGVLKLDTRTKPLRASTWDTSNILFYRVSVDQTKIGRSWGGYLTYADWTADITVTGPGYRQYDWTYGSNWRSMYPAPLVPGTYTVRADVTVDGWMWDPFVGSENYETGAYWGTIRQKVVVKNRSVIKQQRAKVGAHKWRTTSTTRVAGKAKGGQSVKLQRKAGRKWVNVASKKTSPKGKASVTVKGRPGQFRWRYAGTKLNAPDVSPVFRMPKR